MRASSDDLSAATSSQAAAVGAAVDAGAAGDAGAAVVGGLVWLGVELVPQPAMTQSRAMAATATDPDRQALRSCI
ncbi:MAG TPA: hypothetical protein VHR39_10715 [Propionibacteriaceae bacterium]|nr:hypothetical protein [Propionibacteriaceae bacterium]